MADDIDLLKICDKSLLEKALTHTSYIKDNNKEYGECYERLEFLGDAVLKLLASQILYEKFPEYDEGRLSKIRSILVADATLSEIAKKIKLDKYLRLGKGEEKTGGRKRESILACAFEAVLGACYLSGKSNKILDFLNKELNSYIDKIDKNLASYHAKEILQEYTQGINGELPIYNTVQTSGSAHKPEFTATVFFKNEQIASAIGKSKKEAQQNCAYNACLKLGVIKE